MGERKIGIASNIYIFDSIKEVQKKSNTQEEEQKTIYLEKIKQNAYQQGFKKGLQEGSIEGFKKGQQDFDKGHIQELQNYIQELENRTESFEKQKKDWMSHLEKELSLLSLYIAERLLHKCFNDERAWVQECTLEITREAISQVIEEESIRVYVNPFDLVYLEEHKTTLNELAPKLHHIELVADRSIPGGCFIETKNGVIDSRVDHMLRKIIEEIIS